MATILGLRAGSVSDAPPPSIIDEHKFALAMPTEADRDFGEGGAGYWPTASTIDEHKFTLARKRTGAFYSLVRSIGWAT